MSHEPLIQIESSIVSLEVLIRTLANADDNQGRLIALHSKHLLHNIAGALHSIRDELSGYLYRNSPTCEESFNESDV